MGGEQQVKTAFFSNIRLTVAPRSLKFVEPLLEGRAEPRSIAEAIRSGEVGAEDVRRAIFRNFANMRISDLGEKKALMGALIEKAECGDQKAVLEHIMEIETGPATYSLFPIAFKHGTDALLEYALEKLAAFQHCPLGTAHEREFFEDVLQTVRQMAMRNVQFYEDAKETLGLISDNGASPRVKALVASELEDMEYYVPTAYTRHGTLSVLAEK